MYFSERVLWYFKFPTDYPLYPRSMAVMKMAAYIPDVDASATGSKMDFTHKQFFGPVWGFSKGLVQGLAFVLFSLKCSQSWSSFPGNVCQMHLEAKVLASAAWDNRQSNQNKQYMYDILDKYLKSTVLNMFKKL